MTRVLIVDDEANIRKFAAVNLQARGYEVVEAADAGEGLARLHDSSPAVVLLDIKLPDMSGWDLIAHASASPGLLTMPVVVMTASINDANAAQSTRYPCVVEVLSKPVSAARLVEAIEKAIREQTHG